MLKTVLIVGFGSFCGGIVRYLTSKACAGIVGIGCPLATLIVNLAGCFLIGAVCSLFERGLWLSPQMKMFLTVGFCGGLTTFSTFMNENFQMANGKDFMALSVYLTVSLVGGFAMLWVGHAAMKLV